MEFKDIWADKFSRCKLLIFEKMIIVMKYHTQIDYVSSNILKLETFFQNFFLIKGIVGQE